MGEPWGGERTRRGGLARWLASPALARLVVWLVVHPDRPVHQRELARRTGLGRRSLENELRRLEEEGLVVRRVEGRRVVVEAVRSAPGWEALRGLVRAFADPAEVLRATLDEVEGVDAAFVCGSQARGDARPDSDVDVFVVGAGDARRAVGRGAADASAVLGMPVEVQWYDREAVRRRATERGGFVDRVMESPKRWIVGDEAAVRVWADHT